MASNNFDDEFFSLDGYTPTAWLPTNSRSGGMRKPTKKQQPINKTNNPYVDKKIQAKKTASKDEFFDDLLEELIQKDDKKQIKKTNHLTNTTYDFEKPSISKDLKLSHENLFPDKDKFSLAFQEKEKEKNIIKPPTITPKVNFQKQVFSLNDDMVDQDNFKKDKFSLNLQEPLRKRESITMKKQENIKPIQDELQINIGGSNRMKPPIGRNRGNTVQNNNNTLETDSIFQNKSENKNQANKKVDIVVPKVQQKSKQIFQNKTIQPQVQQKNKLNTNNLNFLTNNQEKQQLDLQQLREQSRKELQFTKQAYQRQIKFITSNLERQLKQQRQNKERIVKQLKQIIQNEKIRYEKALDSQIQRIKQISRWEKQKIQLIYKSQIDSLKGLLDKTKNQNENYISGYEKKRIKQQEDRLKNQLELLEAQKKNMKKIQQQLQDRENAFKKFRQSEQKRIREQYIKIRQKETKQMKKISDLMRNLYQQKQKMAIEMANLEMELNRKRQELDQRFNQLQQEKQAFERGKKQFQAFNSRTFMQIKTKLKEAEQSKRNNLNLENQLINKLRIVELRQKDIVKDQVQNTKQQDNWIKQPSQNKAILNQKEKQRVKKVEKYVGKSSRIQEVSKNKFSLEDFMLNMDKYSKTKQFYVQNQFY